VRFAGGQARRAAGFLTFAGRSGAARARWELGRTRAFFRDCVLTIGILLMLTVAILAALLVSAFAVEVLLPWTD